LLKGLAIVKDIQIFMLRPLINKKENRVLLNIFIPRENSYWDLKREYFHIDYDKEFGVSCRFGNKRRIIGKFSFKNGLVRNEEFYLVAKEINQRGSKNEQKFSLSYYCLNISLQSLYNTTINKDENVLQTYLSINGFYYFTVYTNNGNFKYEI
jgi:hypothetical protein